MLKKDKGIKNILKKDKRTKQILLGALVFLSFLNIYINRGPMSNVEILNILPTLPPYIWGMGFFQFVSIALLAMALLLGWAIFKTFKLGKIGVITMVLFEVIFFIFVVLYLSTAGDAIGLGFLVSLVSIVGFVSSMLLLVRDEEMGLGLILLAFFGYYVWLFFGTLFFM